MRASEELVRILNMRMAAAVLNGRVEKASAHIKAAAAVSASVKLGTELGVGPRRLWRGANGILSRVTSSVPGRPTTRSRLSLKGVGRG